MDKKTTALLNALQTQNKLTKREALTFLKGLTPDGQEALRLQLKLERDGQQRLPQFAYPEPPATSRAKKVAYTLLLPPDMLEAVKDAAERDGSSASQFIRTAIAKQLGRVK